MSPRFDPSQIWRVKEDVYTSFTLGNMYIKDETMGIDNGKEIGRSYREITEDIDISLCDRMHLPPGFPSPNIALPIEWIRSRLFFVGVY